MYEVDWETLPFQSEGARGTILRFRDVPQVIPSEEDDNVADEHEELSVVSATRMPNGPTADEIAAHNVTHEQCRAWCRDCVTGAWHVVHTHRA